MTTRTTKGSKATTSNSMPGGIQIGGRFTPVAAKPGERFLDAFQGHAEGECPPRPATASIPGGIHIGRTVAVPAKPGENFLSFLEGVGTTRRI